jgi:hypothetical protein
LKAHTYIAPTYELYRCRRAIGVELELATWGVYGQSKTTYDTLLPLLPHFAGAFVRDGSVSPSEMELVSKKMEGDSVLLGLTELCTALHGSGATANETCGMHVHVDAADFSMYDLRRVILAWEVLCPKLWGTLVLKRRSTNPYCTSNILLPSERERLCAAGTATEITDWFYHYLYGVSKLNYDSHPQWRSVIRQKREHKYENPARRQALNFHSWMMRGTLEFRLKEGTVDPGDLLWWPQWCGWLVEWLGRQDDRVIDNWRTHGVPPLPELTRNFHPSVAATGLLAWVESKCTPTPRKDSNVIDDLPF